jgi:hypothetical protein
MFETETVFIALAGVFGAAGIIVAALPRLRFIRL